MDEKNIVASAGDLLANAGINSGTSDSSKARRGQDEERARVIEAQLQQQMHITIDSQSFVNLGQLMGSRTNFSSSAVGAAGGASSIVRGGNIMAASLVLSDRGGDEDDDDFDQIFHPTGSSLSAWSGQDMCCSDREGTTANGEGSTADGATQEIEDFDEDDSILPALPLRSPEGSDRSGSICPIGSSTQQSGGEWAEDLNNSGSSADGGSVDWTISSGALPDGLASSSGAILSDAASGGVMSSEKDRDAAITPETQLGGFGHVPPADAGTPAISTISTATATLAIGKQPSPVEATPRDVARGASEEALASEVSSSAGPVLHESSWLYVPMENSTMMSRVDHESNSNNNSNYNTQSSDAVAETDGETDATKEQYRHQSDKTGAWRRVGDTLGDTLGECTENFVHVMEKAIELAKPSLQQLARLAKEHAEAGASACARGCQAAMEAVDRVPQAPVRVWLGRIAGSLITGAILGAAAYSALPRAAMPGSPPMCPTRTAADTTSPWWNAPTGGCESSAGGPEPGFGDRLNKALFAARAGEAAAQQGLLEEVRTILAATGKSGGISAEQILRQFNAKRFAEASKAWSAAEGISGSDPLDPLFFAPPSAPIYKTNPPSASQPQHSAPFGRSSSDSGGSAATNTDESFSSADGSVGPQPSRSYHHKRSSGSAEGTSGSGRHYHRRPCAGGGWVC